MVPIRQCPTMVSFLTKKLDQLFLLFRWDPTAPFQHLYHLQLVQLLVQLEPRVHHLLDHRQRNRLHPHRHLSLLQLNRRLIVVILQSIGTLSRVEGRQGSVDGLARGSQDVTDWDLPVVVIMRRIRFMLMKHVRNNVPITVLELEIYGDVWIM